MSPHEFLDVRMALAAAFELRETSGHRSPASNQRLGGVTHSAHLFFLAVDVILDEPADRAAFLEDANRLGLLALDEGDHIHLQPLDWRAG